MLNITIPAQQLWDSVKEEFIYTKETKLQLEHSLVSITKWEEKHHKTFLKDDPPKTRDETIDYIRCMTITQNINPDAYNYLTPDNMRSIEEYIKDPMTSLVFPKENRVSSNRDVLSHETLYYYMFKLGIPMECQKWHINALIALIKVFDIKDAPKKKSSTSDAYAEHRAAHAARRKHK